MTPLQHPGTLLSCYARGSFRLLATYMNTESGIDVDFTVCDPLYSLVTRLDYFRLDAK
jgi:hypothetical protein